MSLFASYYGINHGPSVEEVQANPGLYINKQQFDAQAYVKVSIHNLA
jgi:hypothetical protein